MGFEAPNVDFLQIGVVECKAGSRKLIEYLASGGSKSSPKPLFPSVTHLKAWLAGGYSPTKLLKALLRAHPQITTLEIPLAPLDALLVKPWLAPNLQHLGVLGPSSSQLKKVVDACTIAKLPLRMVDADALLGCRMRSVDRKYLSSKVEFRFVKYLGGPQVVNDVLSEDKDDSLLATSD
ncbi:hypothetical protein FRC08_010611 [Ceratobasidium sp. 394]|nr:hypothetical protein FRC08_010611 [Ceratobasidium sp. 394]